MGRLASLILTSAPAKIIAETPSRATWEEPATISPGRIPLGWSLYDRNEWAPEDTGNHKTGKMYGQRQHDRWMRLMIMLKGIYGPCRSALVH